MLISPIGLPLDKIDSPALLLDLDAFESNRETMGRFFKERGVQWRPHAKAFKSPAIAHALRNGGAIGVTVAKVSEAEVMASNGIDDILIAHLVVGPSKVARLAALQRSAEVKATVDHIDQINPMSRAASGAGVEIGILVDIDLGMRRCGVRSPELAAELALRVAEAPGLRFDGVMGYEGHTLFIPDPTEKRVAIEQAIGRLMASRDAIESVGLSNRIVSAGGSGSYQITSNLPGITEIQAGGGVFCCRYYTEVCRITGHTPAVAVLATIVGRPDPDRVILDIGRKSISDFMTPPTLPDHPGSQVVGLSAEHATVEIARESPLRIGDRVRVIPGYSDFTFVLHDRILAHRKGTVEAVWPLLGRGMLQ